MPMGAAEFRESFALADEVLELSLRAKASHPVSSLTIPDERLEVARAWRRGPAAAAR